MDEANLKNRLLDMFYSYYGGLTCVCWSPDAKYVLTGGQDDLISIWSTADSALVARCQGHHSWVASVAFDPWRCDDRNYRFGSVGEDGRLCLWDFNVGMLHRPRAVSETESCSKSPDEYLTEVFMYTDNPNRNIALCPPSRFCFVEIHDVATGRDGEYRSIPCAI